jgi:hypothetical protein
MSDGEASWVHLFNLINPGFFLRILRCSQGGDHPETNVANSDYMPDM